MRLRLLTFMIVLILLVAPAAGAVTPVRAQEGAGTHTVQAGENLYRIALKYNTTWPVLAQLNGITNPNLIYVGQVLKLPGAGTPTPPTTPPTTPATPTPPTPPTAPVGTYTVVAGDTLYKIAVQFNTTVAALVQANGIVNPNLIYVGQVIKIPGATTTTPPTTPTTPTTPATPTTPTTPAQPPAATGSFELGGHVDSFGYPSLMRQAGMTWAKRQIRYKLGDSPDVAAGAINQAHSQGFRILLGIVGDPAQLAGGGTYMDQYAGFVAGVARLGPDAIEVWNEQNLDREWPTGQINPATYTQLLAKAYAAIKQANPSVMVISGAPAPTGAEGAFGTSRVWNDDRYIRGMAQAGAASYADCIGLHYNEGIISPSLTSGDPRDYNSYTRYFWGMVNTYWAAFGGAKPLCFTELGYLSPEGYGPLPSGFAWAQNVTVAQQAQWLAQAATLSRSSGKIRLMIVWNVDFTDYGVDPMAGYAIIRQGGSCPACATLDQVMP